ncbi:hypothetical protein QCE62_24115 [Caballeronia sp. LZ033]|nr:hypothetical protein [Caballeronia sp. LZ033]
MQRPRMRFASRASCLSAPQTHVMTALAAHSMASVKTNTIPVGTEASGQ